MDDLDGLAMRASTPDSTAGKGRAVSRRDTQRPIGIDLFAGVGGLSLGFEQAGFDVVAAVEVDPIHAAAHLYNFPTCTVIPKSVSLLTSDGIRTASSIGNRDIDVVFGGAPCQGFSMIGQRALDDPRNGLVRDYVRLVAELRPKFAVFENVKGLTVGRHRAFLMELIEALGTVGYRIRQPWRVLDAADFGVPQHRERLILLAAREDAALPEYPTPVCYAADRSEVRGLRKGPTCADALGDLPDPEEFLGLGNCDEIEVRNWRPRTSYAREMRCLDESDWHFGYRRSWNPNLLTASLLTEHTAISRRRFATTKGGDNEPISRFFKLRSEGLCNTLRAGTDAARGAFTSPRPIHYSRNRCITVREMARLHGFPDWFRFHMTKWHGARQIGNAVPPPLARAVATQIIEALGVARRAPKPVLQLGDGALLRMDISAASAYFSIPVPIGKRDRKSGAKKRKQSEIENAESRR